MGGLIHAAMGSVAGIGGRRTRRGGVGGRKDDGALGAPRRGKTVMHVVRLVQAEIAVPVLGVVPREEVGAMRPRVFERAEALGKVGAVQYLGVKIDFQANDL